MEVPDLLTSGVVRYPERTCISAGEASWSFEEVDSRADRAARAFLDIGLSRGDRVALLAENEAEYLEIQIATQRAGLIFVPLNYRLSNQELQFIIDDCEPRLLIAGHGYGGTAERLAGVPNVWRLSESEQGQSYTSTVGGTPLVTMPRFFEAETINTILYTSGTTGRPKGAMISNGALWARVITFSDELGVFPGDVLLQPLPMFHIAAHLAYAFPYKGATLVTPRRFEGSQVAPAIETHRATHVLLVPTMINMLCDDVSVSTADLTSLRRVHYGASPIAPSVLERAMATFGCDFSQTFGMTETGVSLGLRPDDHDLIRHPDRIRAAGTPPYSMAVRIVDIEDPSNEVADGVVGEIVTRGPSVMTGYWRDEAKTSDAMRDGWVHTGDLGYRMPDGYIRVSDRLNHTIISGGENVYPREVEDIIQSHPGVDEVAVLGLPDNRWGELVHASVIRKGDAAVTVDDLQGYCGEHIASYKVPKSIHFVDSLPRNATGKVLKHVLKDQLSGPVQS